MPIITFLDMADAFGNCRQEGGVDFRGGKKPLAFLKQLLSIAVDPKESAIALDLFCGELKFHACLPGLFSSRCALKIEIQSQ